MALTSKSRGKKRALEDSAANTNLVAAPLDQAPAKKPRRAETRKCPVCEEAIPVRLLGRHAELEAQRVEEIVRQIGSTECILDDVEEGPSTGTRKSAKKARKSMSAALHPRSAKDTLEHTNKTLQGIKRRRKQRHSTLREMTREDEEGPSDQSGFSRITGGGEMVCPICSTTVRGDQDVLEAHVDACLANESIRQRQEREQEEALRRVQQQQQVEQWEEYPEVDGAVGHVGDVRGTGFLTRNREEQDVDDEVDIDGEDQTFGDTQFTEGDILGPSSEESIGEDLQVEIDGDEEDEAQLAQKTLRDLIAGGVKHRPPENGTAQEHASEVTTVEEIDLEIQAARKKGNRSKLVTALERKVDFLQSTPASTALQCRICLDPYDEPTVSIGCWHTCCRECWLRCLGSTKLCPICKRITGATDLRKIYL
ncbi:hypothetical protein BDN72DRAFT_825991 [Pluteus cervinus]|uniref:Uncharacterized protein n=1 Tax=Pluteus cervinus TaxID=181527 RepID=A0ACD3AEM7_9AGAR|nr:hypothetical protein BDN72DRAFT_825991 [Pluteus cervinus]